MSQKRGLESLSSVCSASNFGFFGRSRSCSSHRAPRIKAKGQADVVKRCPSPTLRERYFAGLGVEYRAGADSSRVVGYRNLFAVTRKQFEALSPKKRGYVSYMLGERADFPEVPDESNPYSAGSKRATEWEAGQEMATIEAQEGDD